MEERHQHDSRPEEATGSGAREKGLVLGLIPGLVATIVVDLMMMGVLRFRGKPADAGFAVIGDSVLRTVGHTSFSVKRKAVDPVARPSSLDQPPFYTFLLLQMLSIQEQFLPITRQISVEPHGQEIVASFGGG